MIPIYLSNKIMYLLLLVIPLLLDNSSIKMVLYSNLLLCLKGVLYSSLLLDKILDKIDIYFYKLFIPTYFKNLLYYILYNSVIYINILFKNIILLYIVYNLYG